MPNTNTSTPNSPSLNRRVSHRHNEYRLNTPHLPPDFPLPIPSDSGLAQRLKELKELPPDTVDVGWDQDDNIRASDRFNVVVPNLYDRGALFIFGKNSAASEVRRRNRRFIVGTRFALEDAETLHQSIRLAFDEGYVSAATLVLPDTQGIRESYGPELRRRIQERMVLSEEQVHVHYHIYLPIIPGQVQLPLESFTARLDDYSIQRHTEMIEDPDAELHSPLPAPLDQELPSFEAGAALPAAFDTTEQVDADFLAPIFDPFESIQPAAPLSSAPSFDREIEHAALNEAFSLFESNPSESSQPTVSVSPAQNLDAEMGQPTALNETLPPSVSNTFGPLQSSISESQIRDIDEILQLLADLDENPPPDTGLPIEGPSESGPPPLGPDPPGSLQPAIPASSPEARPITEDRSYIDLTAPSPTLVPLSDSFSTNTGPTIASPPRFVPIRPRPPPVSYPPVQAAMAAPFPHPPLDLPGMVMQYVPISQAVGDNSGTVDEIGMWSTQGARVSAGNDIRISDIIVEGGVFVHGRYNYNNARFLAAARFPFYNLVSLVRACQVPMQYGRIDRIKLFLPATPDTMYRYDGQLKNLIIHVVGYALVIETSFYHFTHENAQRPSFAYSFTAHVNHLNLEWRTYPVTGIQFSLAGAQ